MTIRRMCPVLPISGCHETYNFSSLTKFFRRDYGKSSVLGMRRHKKLVSNLHLSLSIFVLLVQVTKFYELGKIVSTSSN